MEASSDEEEDPQPLPSFDEFYEILVDRKRHYGIKKNFPTLRISCLKTIKRHSKFFLQIFDNTGLNPFNVLPNTLKTDLLQDGNAYYKTWGTWEKMLVNKSFCRLMISMDPDEDSETFTNFCSTLATEQFQMKIFTWSSVYSINKSKKKTESALIPLAIIISSPQFTNLQSLHLFFICNDQHLQMIATNLRKLRQLKLYLDAVTSKGISALSTLDQLQKFLFTSNISRNAGNISYNLCLQLLPKLIEIGYEDVDLASCDDDIDSKIGNEVYTVKFKSLPTPTELGVRQLFLHKYVGVIPQGVSMPNLTSLYLGHPLIDFPLDKCFSNVTDLGLLELGMDEYLRILSFMGQKVQRLLIVEQGEDLQLDLILRLCPNLEELYIPMSPRNVSFTFPMNPDSDLQNLKVLRLKLFNHVVDQGNPEISPGALVQLLSAPNLRVFKLTSVDLTKEEAAAIIQGVQQGKILQKLEKFHVENFDITVCDEGFFKQELRDRYYCVLDNMVRHCPCLYEFHEQEFG